MKLSDILGWIKKQPLITGQGANNRNKDVQFCRGFNTALTSCDREIDREALVKLLYDEFCNAMSWENVDINTRVMFLEHADKIISTMPTWLRKVEGK